MRSKSLIIGMLAAGLCLPSVWAATLEDVVAKHIQARGGAEAWSRIETIRGTGTFTSFSKVAPFTLHRQRDSRYHLDTRINDHKMVVGFDGNEAWWDIHMLQEGAQLIGGPDLTAQQREFDFITPLFEIEQRGYQAKLIDESEVEGLPAIAIELTRPDETVETWYLDPDTHLEIARRSPGSDFGNPMEQLTFFDDFREVGGLRIPHLVETQWYTRDRVFRFDSIELNAEFDGAIFAMPAPPGMGPLQAMAGDWQVTTQRRQQPGAPWQESQRSTTISRLLRGAILQESYTEDGTDAIWNLTYDKIREVYRMSSVDSNSTYMDILEGTADENGRVTVSNAETGTPGEVFGTSFHSRVSFDDVSEEGFLVEIEVSMDGGENWWVAMKQDYRRAEP